MNAPVNPAALAPGDRVLLRCAESRHPTMNTCEARFVAAGGGLYAFRIGAVVFGAQAHDDGTLRDDEGRVVEVLSANP